MGDRTGVREGTRVRDKTGVGDGTGVRDGTDVGIGEVWGWDGCEG